MRKLLPKLIPGTWWKHRNGNMYEILMITNRHHNNYKYPITVVSQGENGELWSRRADDWHRSLILVPDYPGTQLNVERIRKEATRIGDLFGDQTHFELQCARAVASAAIEKYGDLNEIEWKDFKERGIWNDHVAVQAALTMLRLNRK